MTVQRKAIALISGGLDSMLAAKMISDQGVYVEGINFYTGFCVEGHTHAIRTQDRKRPKRNNALWVSDRLGIKLHIVDVIEKYKDVVLDPRHGYGANLNPCLDCKTFMVGQAREWMEQHEYDFIITGEVVGQRPKSQTKRIMPIVAAESRTYDRLLRPLSAKLLAPTLPEREGWVDRHELGDISGRSRKSQIAMAQRYGIEDFAQPAGGCCFLTDRNYAAKMRDMWRSRGEKRYDFDDIMLLKVGRHLRPKRHFKLIVARDDGENNFLRGYRNKYTQVHIDDHPGPVALVDGDADVEELTLAARITARFGKGREACAVRARIRRRDGSELLLSVAPLRKDQIPRGWYV